MPPFMRKIRPRLKCWMHVEWDVLWWLIQTCLPPNLRFPFIVIHTSRGTFNELVGVYYCHVAKGLQLLESLVSE